MPPKFSLQTVLDVRHSRVEALEIELGELMTALQEGQNMLSALVAHRAELFHELEVKLTGEVDLFAANHLHADINSTGDRINQVKEAIAILEQRVSDKRSELVTARQAEETISILKNKEIERYNEEQARHENKAVDDIYIAQAWHRST